MKTLGILLALIVVGIIAYKVAYPTTVYRFRITVNVDTPRGLKTGSSVLEVRHRTYPAWTTLGNNTGASTLTGEAVFVDLGSNPDGRPLNVVALLAQGQRAQHVDFDLLPGMTFVSHWKGKYKHFGTPREVSELPVGTRAEVQSNLIPTLVSFSNPSDPNTARVVSPSDFESVFGSGTRLRNVEIEIVSPGTWPLTLIGFSGEPVTRELEKKLTWISHVTGYLNGQFSCNPSAESCLNVGHFRRK
ncbi:hypothetical protein [Nitrobacter winogradskyi]|uniref:Uncharacterized protein n=2 Tax=Nitrobacter winogradskyi TaxID=913 RepID=A0ACC6AFH9_NITWI|nr:hypothetical protein [Nitrobacter winogradskyi]MCP1998610.1 hypothetical protein [Nitrobacter winogradskyi]GEC15549.1 hypothetical protein NWI01_14410 [Nitrobacter winogradskyi]